MNFKHNEYFDIIRILTALHTKWNKTMDFIQKQKLNFTQ